MPDEKSLRREDFDGEHSSPVVLGDGQTWYIPKPWLSLRPAGGNGRTAGYLKAGPELDGLIDAAEDTDDPSGQILAFCTLAALMLGHNYDLSGGELGLLLRYRPGDPECDEMVAAVMNAATGSGAPRTFARWRRLTLLAACPGDLVLLEDATDLTRFLEYAERTIPRTKWAEESIRAAELRQLEGLI